jgi:hypothetical protein
MSDQGQGEVGRWKEWPFGAQMFGVGMASGLGGGDFRAVGVEGSWSCTIEGSNARGLCIVPGFLT